MRNIRRRDRGALWLLGDISTVRSLSFFAASRRRLFFPRVRYAPRVLPGRRLRLRAQAHRLLAHAARSSG